MSPRPVRWRVCRTWPQWLPYDLRRPRAFHDAPWSGPVLWWSGAAQERALRSWPSVSASPASGHDRSGSSCGYSLVLGEHGAANASPGRLRREHPQIHDARGRRHRRPTQLHRLAFPEAPSPCSSSLFAIITPALIVGAIAERMKFAAIMLFSPSGCSLVYFPLAHMVWGFDGSSMASGMAAPHHRHRLRRRHRGSHDFRLERPRALPHPRQAPRIWQRAHGPAQHGALYGRHRHALGRLVWLQRRFRPRR